MSGDEPSSDRRRSSSLVTRHSSLLFLPLFAALAAAFLAPVLFGDRALLPTDYLIRMSPWSQTQPAAGSGGAGRPEVPWDPILWDAIAQFYPWRAFTAHWLRRGVIPFWDPHQFCGTPFLANSQSAPLYPLHLLLLGFVPGLPVARAMALLAAIHLTLAGFLTFLWLRALRLSPFAASLGGVAFMFSSFAVTWLELPSFLTVACWLPFLFLTIHRVFETPTGPRIAAVAVAVALVLLGGHLQIAFYCLLGAGLYGACMCGVQALRPSTHAAGGYPRRGWSVQVPGRRRLNAWTPGRLILAAGLGLMLAAPQLLPAVELSRHSHRAAATTADGYVAYLRGAMPAYQLVRLFLPDFYGNPTRGHYDAGSPSDYTEFGAFIGGVGLLLAVAGLLAWGRRPRETVPAALIAAFALLLALGTPLNALLYYGIPGFSQSGSPARVLVLFCFAGAWLAALGAEALTEAPAAQPDPDLNPLDRSAAVPPGDPRSADLPVGEAPSTAGLPVSEADLHRAGRKPDDTADRKVGATLGDGRSLSPGEEHERRADEEHDATSGAPAAAPSDPREAQRHPTRTVLRGSRALIGRWLPLIALAGWLTLLGGALWAASIFVTSRGVDFAQLLARSGPALELALISALLAAGVPAGLKQLARAGSVSASLAGVLARGVLAALLLGELWFYGAGFNPTGPLAEVYPTTPLTDALRSGAAAGTGRVLPLNHRWSLIEQPRAVLPPNSALALGLSDPQGYDSLFIGRYKGFTNLLVPGGDSAPLQNGNMLFLWDPHSPLLPLLAADRIVSEGAISAIGNRSADLPVGVAGGREPGAASGSSAALPVGAPWPLLYSRAGLRVYRYPGALPRSFVATAWRLERDQHALAQDLLGLSRAGQLGTTALIEGPTTSGGPVEGKGPLTTGRMSQSMAKRGVLPAPAVVQEISPNETRISLEGAARPGLLVLLDNFYPGWHARDEATGASLPIHRTDLTFRGVEVGEGGHTIRLRYEPASFRLGFFLCLLALASTAALSLARRSG